MKKRINLILTGFLFTELGLWLLCNTPHIDQIWVPIDYFRMWNGILLLIIGPLGTFAVLQRWEEL
jgi:hypothetical protein